MVIFTYFKNHYPVTAREKTSKNLLLKAKKKYIILMVWEI